MVEHTGQSEMSNEYVRQMNSIRRDVDSLDRKQRSLLRWATCIRQNPATIDVSIETGDGHRHDVRDVNILHTTHPVSVGDSGLLITLPSQRKLFVALPTTPLHLSHSSLGSVFSGTITSIYTKGNNPAIPVLAEVRLIHNPDVTVLTDIPDLTPGTVEISGSRRTVQSNRILVGRRCWLARDSGIAVWRLNAIEPYPPRHVLLAVMRPEDDYEDTSPTSPPGYDTPYEYGKPTGIVSLADLEVTGTPGLVPGFSDEYFAYNLRVPNDAQTVIVTSTLGSRQHRINVYEGAVSNQIQVNTTGPVNLVVTTTLTYPVVAGEIDSNPLVIQLEDVRGNITEYILNVSRSA